MPLRSVSGSHMRSVSRPTSQLQKRFTAHGGTRYPVYPANYFVEDRKDHRQKLAVIGSGITGLSATAHLAGEYQKTLAYVDPNPAVSNYHGFSSAGAGLSALADHTKALSNFLPNYHKYIQDEVVEFVPEQKYFLLKSGIKVHYFSLVLAMGLQARPDLIKGLTESLGSNGVTSNYINSLPQTTWNMTQTLESGKAVFTFPKGTVRGPGGSLSALFLASHYWKQSKRPVEVEYYTGHNDVYENKHFGELIQKLMAERGIKVHLGHNLVEVRPESKEAVFETADGRTVVTKFNFLHATPSHATPHALRNSPFVDQNGFVDVNPSDLTVNNFPYHYALGDCTNLPTSKTLLGTLNQAKHFRNIYELSMRGDFQELQRQLSKGDLYTGYTGEIIFTGGDKALFAEWDYFHEFLQTLPVNQRTPNSITYNFFVKYYLPWALWQRNLRGKNDKLTDLKCLFKSFTKTSSTDAAHRDSFLKQVSAVDEQQKFFAV